MLHIPLDHKPGARNERGRAPLDIDVILLWLGLFSAVLLLSGGRGALWMVKAVLLLGLAVESVLFHPLVAGWLVGAAWIALVVVPLLVARLGDMAVVGQRYALAAALCGAASLLHPDPALRGRIPTIRALLMARRGLFDRALAQLGRIADSRRTARPIALNALAHRRRLEGRLDLLLDEVAWADEEPSLATVLRLRALASLGRAADAVAVQSDKGRALRDSPATNWALGLLWLFVATGRVSALRRLLAGPLRLLPSQTRAFYVASAALAAGADADAARATLAAIAAAPDRDLAQAALRVLAAEPAVVTLTGREMAVIAAAETDLDAKLRARAGAPRLARAPLTLSLIALNVAAFAAELARGGSEDTPTLLRLGALWPPYVLRLGQWWRIGAAPFLHLGWMHLGLNMLALAVLGPRVERSLAWWRMLLVYAAAGLGSMAGIVLLTRLGWMPNEVVLGASGAIMGLIGALLAQAARAWWLSRSRVALGRLAWVIAVVALQSVLDVATPQISFAGHALGALIGFMVALMVGDAHSEHAATPPGAAAGPSGASALQRMRSPRRRLALAAIAGVVALGLATDYPARRDRAILAAARAVKAPVITPLQLAALRRLRFVFVEGEAGGPEVDPHRPFGSADPLSDLIALSGTAQPRVLARLYLETMQALPLLCASARLEPGSYLVDGSLVAVSAEQLRLISGLVWEVPAFDDASVIAGSAAGWPVDSVDTKRPYGDMTLFEADMAERLGLPVGRDRDGAASLPDDVLDHLDALHRTMATTLRAFVVHARIE